ncbi:MAG TPA: M28 family peptidase [Candidatus Anoxymicrobiaceae bacterium]
MFRRRKLWLALTLILGLAIGAAGGYLAQAKLKPKPKTKVVKVTQSSSPSTTAKKYAAATPADPEKIRQVMTFLSANIGPRPEGKAGEKQAASYLLTELQKLGFKLGMEEFVFPSGSNSQNLVTADPGQSDKYTFFICAHIDTKSGSPGANDDASGCAAVLEIARTIKGTKHYPEVRLLLFGAEENNSSGVGRFGSRHYLATQPEVERAKIIGVLSLDTIGVGSENTFRDWGARSPVLADALATFTQGKGLVSKRLQGQESDHQPFGDAGIPAVWLERMLPGSQSDTKAGDSEDTMDHVYVNLVSESVNLTRDYLLSLDAKTCKSMYDAAHAPTTGTQPGVETDTSPSGTNN